jgi:enoyl-CoA hydratase
MGVRYEADPTGVATVTLDDPERRNALSDALLDELLAALARAREDPAVRCVVLASSHPRVFSAGGDLAAFAAEAPLLAKHEGTAARIEGLFRALGELGKPSLCAAGGHVLAGALGLALACDLVIAREGVTFGTPELDVGVFPFMVCALLQRNVGRKAAAELLLLGDPVDARAAERMGIVNRVVAAEEFDGAVRAWAEKLAAKPPALMRLGKDAMHRTQDMALDDALDYLRAQLTIATATEDLHEGVRAFFEKRAPVWTGR